MELRNLEIGRLHLARGLRSFLLRTALAILGIVIVGGMLSFCFAFDGPPPDPAGTATGDRTTTFDAGGNSFVVPLPPDPSAPDYAEKKKAYDEFQVQLAKEPLAGKLADHVGHLRVGTNFSWTLLTGYLVLFMQAGFALLTCGLVRKKNAGHLMMLNFAAYVFAFLAYYAVGYAFQFGAVAVNAAPLNLGGAQHSIDFSLAVARGDFSVAKDFFSRAPAMTREVFVSPCLKWFSWKRRVTSSSALSANASLSGHSYC